jgi:hypothetical protein
VDDIRHKDLNDITTWRLVFCEAQLGDEIHEEFIAGTDVAVVGSVCFPANGPRSKSN